MARLFRDMCAMWMPCVLSELEASTGKYEGAYFLSCDIGEVLALAR